MWQRCTRSKSTDGSSLPRCLRRLPTFDSALMNLQPWALWDLRTGKPTEGAKTIEAKNVLELAMRQDGGMQHPGVLHFYIHLMEMSSTPEAALPAADALRDLALDAGHLQHMPTHIDV